jgi:hypothetical protein
MHVHLPQRGHVLRVEFQCQQHKQKKWWASSRTLGGCYLFNQKFHYFPFITRGTEIFSGLCIHSLVLVFCRASTSILPLMQTWARWGHGTSIRVSLQKKCSDGRSTLYCLLVYNNGGYLEVMNTCAKLSMMKAVLEVPNYAASGEVHVCAHL